MLDVGEERSAEEDGSFNGLLAGVPVLLNDCDLLTADDTARAKEEGLEVEYGCGKMKVLSVFRFSGGRWEGGDIRGSGIFTEVETSGFSSWWPF